MPTLFGAETSTETGFDRPPHGIIYRSVSQVFGEILITEAARDDSELGEDNFKACSVLREQHLRGRKVLVCRESQKANLLSFMDNLVLKSIQDLVSEFPKGIGDIGNRILLNLHAMAPNYGETIEQV